MKKYALIWCSEIPNDTLRERLLGAFRAEGEHWDVLSPADSDFGTKAPHYGGYIISGSEKSVVDDAETPFVKNLLALLRGLYDRAAVPVLGICFGAQALAVALGGRVGRNPSGGFRLGVEKIEWTSVAGIARWPGSSLPAVLVESHGECVVELPPGGVLLGSSATINTEIFLVGERFLGVQGHPELHNRALQEILLPLHRSRFSAERWPAVERESEQPLQPEAVIALGRQLLTAGSLEVIEGPAHVRPGAAYQLWEIFGTEISMNASAWDRLIRDDRVHRSIYTDDRIFAREMNQVFAATWAYLLHESEIPEANDFRQAWIGTRQVIVTRDDRGLIHVLSNRCSHRGATVCREHRGNASSFTCPYHGWKYDNSGQLFAIPGKAAYGPAFKARSLNLSRPAQVASYRGFVFATLNPEAEPLDAHLGHAKRFIDEWIGHQGGENNIIISGAQRFHMDCNWKMVFDNAGDGYHVPFSHQSLLQMTSERYGGGDMAYFAQADRSSMKLYALGNGHTCVDQRPDMFSISAWEQQRPQPGREPFERHVAAAAGPESAKAVLDSAVGAGMNLNIFPNLLLIGNQVQVIQPLKVDATAIHWYATRRRDADPELNTIRMRTQEDFPIMGEVDDASNFEECQRGLTSCPEDEWIDISRHLETGQDIVGEQGLLVGPVTSEMHMRMYYTEWKRLMAAEPVLQISKENVKR